MKNANFIAIDFETATTDRKPCQLGIVVVKNGSIVQKMEYLIQPQNNFHDYLCTGVHKIDPKDTANAPYFEVVWGEIKDYFDCERVVAHNASFDRDVLCRALSVSGIEIPKTEFICTYKMTGLNLEDACLKYGIDLPKHHNALCDAEAAAKIYLKLLKNGVGACNLGVYNPPNTRRETIFDIPIGAQRELDGLEITEDKLFKNISKEVNIEPFEYISSIGGIAPAVISLFMADGSIRGRVELPIRPVC